MKMQLKQKITKKPIDNQLSCGYFKFSKSS